MKDKKHIDELFQEGFKGYQPTPSPEVWRNIQAELKKDEDDRKIIPLWWRLGGVAALLALLLTVGKFVFFPTDGADQPLVVDETKVEQVNEESKSDQTTPQLKDAVVDTNQEQPSTNESIADQNENSSENPSKGELNTPTKSQQIVTTKSQLEEAVASQDAEKVTPTNKETSNRNPRIKEAISNPNKEAVVQDAVATHLENTKKDTENTKNTSVNPLIKKGLETQVSEAVAATETKEQNPSSNNSNPSTKRDLKQEIEKETGVSGVAIAAETQEETKDAASDEVPSKEQEKPSIFDAIEEAKEAVAEQQQEPTQGKGWEVTPNFGPVFYNSLSEGSSLDPSFADNSQSGDVNFSYGVGVSYHINERLSIRSGINNVNVGYTTGDIELATGPVASALRSVDYGNSPVVLSAFDRGSLRSASEMPGTMNPLDNFTLKSEGGNAEINQSITYYEIPMELKYALVNNRIGINMIGGFSTLLLGNNEVSVQDGDFSSTLGEANNLNNLSFSTNIGLGFDYKFSRRFKFNIEPMFKYQLNPYSDSSVNFRPYYLGVYSGLSFRF